MGPFFFFFFFFLLLMWVYLVYVSFVCLFVFFFLGLRDDIDCLIRL